MMGMQFSTGRKNSAELPWSAVAWTPAWFPKQGGERSYTTLKLLYLDWIQLAFMPVLTVVSMRPRGSADWITNPSPTVFSLFRLLLFNFHVVKYLNESYHNKNISWPGDLNRLDSQCLYHSIGCGTHRVETIQLIWTRCKIVWMC